MIHTIEASPAGSLPHGLTMVSAHVDSLAGRGDCTFAVPSDPDADLPLVILLHGVYGSHWSWPLQGGAGATLERLIAGSEIKSMVLAMPSDGLAGFATGYRNTDRGRFAEWIVEDVPELAKQIVPRLGSKKFIGGISLGGWGAMMLAAESGGFSAIAAHSAVTTPSDLAPFAVGPSGFDSERDLVGSDIAGVLTAQGALPPLYFDCGRQDPLLKSNRALHSRLESAGIAHSYEEAEGGHDWDFWTNRLPSSLRFFNNHFR